METKANLDIATLPWIRDNALNNLRAPKNIVILNDFVDGATAWTAYELSIQRFGLETQDSLPRTPASILESLKAREKLLRKMVEQGSITIAASEDATAVEKSTLAIIKAVAEEAEAERKAQEQVVAAKASVTVSELRSEVAAISNAAKW